MHRSVLSTNSALGWMYMTARRQARKKSGMATASAAPAVTSDVHAVWAPRCPTCGQGFACSEWRPTAVSTFVCLDGCGTFRYHHRHRLLRRSPPARRPARVVATTAAECPDECRVDAPATIR